MNRPRLLLVPQLTHLEWLIRPTLEEWADVASFDAPGVGDEPPVRASGQGAIAERASAELQRREWDRCVVVADEFGASAATKLLAMRPDVAQGFAFGHARLSNDLDPPRAPIDREIYEAMLGLQANNYRAWVHQMTRLTKGELHRGGYEEELARRYIERVPSEVAVAFWKTRPEAGREIGEVLRSLDCPLLLARHEGCVMFTEEGFDDAVTALPAARAISVDEKPSASVAFADALRVFCAEIGTEGA